MLGAAQNASSSAVFELQSGVVNLLSGQPDFPQLFELFEQTLQGQSPSSSNSTPDRVSYVGIPIICNDIGNQLYSDPFPCSSMMD